MTWKKVIGKMICTIIVGGLIAGVHNINADKPLPPIGFGTYISDKAPYLNQTIMYTCKICSRVSKEYPNSSMEIFLPEGFEFISGDLSWHGTLYGGKTIQINATIKAIKLGKWIIKARFVVPGSEEEGYISNQTIFTNTIYVKDPRIILSTSISGYKYSIPLINETITFTCKAESKVDHDFPNSTMEIILPEGFEFISGDLYWQGTIHAYETIQISAKIKVLPVGGRDITTRVKCEGEGNPNITEYTHVDVSYMPVIRETSTPVKGYTIVGGISSFIGIGVFLVARRIIKM